MSEANSESNGESDDEQAIEVKLDEDNELERLKPLRDGLDVDSLEMNDENGEKNYNFVVPPWDVLMCAKVAGGFTTGKSFLESAGAEAVQQLGGLLGELSCDYKLVAFGHTDASGGGSGNQALSERRAKSCVAMATGDVDTWVSLADDESWGDDQVKSLLRNLGYPTGAGDDAFKESVKAYQAASELKDDGIAGPITKKSLFTKYIDKYKAGVKAEQFMDPKFVGCGEKNPLADVDAAHESNRRVVFFAFKAPRLPTIPSGGELQTFYDKIAKECACEELAPIPTPTSSASRRGSRNGSPFMEDCPLLHQGK